MTIVIVMEQNDFSTIGLVCRGGRRGAEFECHSGRRSRVCRRHASGYIVVNDGVYEAVRPFEIFFRATEQQLGPESVSRQQLGRTRHGLAEVRFQLDGLVRVVESYVHGAVFPVHVVVQLPNVLRHGDAPRQRQEYGLRFVGAFHQMAHVHHAGDDQVSGVVLGQLFVEHGLQVFPDPPGVQVPLGHRVLVVEPADKTTAYVFTTVRIGFVDLSVSCVQRVRRRERQSLCDV